MTPTAHKELQARIDRLTGNTKPRDSTTCLNAHRKDLRDYGLFAENLSAYAMRGEYSRSLLVVVKKDNEHAGTFDALNATALQRSRAFLAAFEPKGTI